MYWKQWYLWSLSYHPLGWQFIEKWSVEESLPFRLDVLMQLEEDKLKSAYVGTKIQNGRTTWLNKHMKQKLLKEGDKILVYNSKLKKYP